MQPLIKNALGSGIASAQQVEILARSLYRELRTNGCGTNEVLAICTQIIDEVTSELKTAVSPEAGANAA
jgi:hypothetical protein